MLKNLNRFKMAINRSSVHVSVPVQRLIRDLILTAPSLDAGVLQFLPGFRKQITLNRFFTTGDNIVAPTAKWDSGTNNDNQTKDEKQLPLVEIEWRNEFNPYEFNQDWPFLWTQGPSVQAQAANDLMDAIMPSTVENFNNTLEKMIWQGDTGGSGSLALMDGLIKKIDADGTVNNADGSGFGSAITDSNVLTALKNLVSACPAEVRELGNPTIVMSHVDKYKYYNALADETITKGVNITDAGRNLYQGFPIFSTHGVPTGRMFMMNAGGGDQAEAKFGTWADNDRFNVEIAQTGPLDRTWGIKMNAEVGVEYIYGKQITEFTAGV